MITHNEKHFHSDYIRSIVISDLTKKLATGSDDRTVKLWDTSLGLKNIYTFIGHTDQVMCVAFSPDGSILISGSEDKTIRVWDVKTGQCRNILREHEEAVYSLVFFDYLLISADVDGTIKVWDTKSYNCNCIRSFKAHTRPITSVVISPNKDRLLSASIEGTIKVWSLRNWPTISPERELIHSENEEFICLTFLDSNIVASGSELKFANKESQGRIILWNLQENSQQELSGHKDKVNHITSFAFGKKLISCSRDNTVKIWEVTKKTCLHTIEYPETVFTVAATPEGDIFSGDYYGFLDSFKFDQENESYKLCSSIGDPKERQTELKISSFTSQTKESASYDAHNPYNTFKPSSSSTQAEPEVSQEENLIFKP